MGVVRDVQADLQEVPVGRDAQGSCLGVVEGVRFRDRCLVPRHAHRTAHPDDLGEELGKVGVQEQCEREVGEGTKTDVGELARVLTCQLDGELGGGSARQASVVRLRKVGIAEAVIAIVWEMNSERGIPVAAWPDQPRSGPMPCTVPLCVPGPVASAASAGVNQLVRLGQARLMQAAAPVLRRLAEDAGYGRLGVFGSVARREAGQDSDIDLLVEAPEGASSFEFIRFKQLLERVLGRPIDLVEYGGLIPKLDDDISRDAVLL